MRYEGSMQVVGFIEVAIEEEGLTREQAEEKIRRDPMRYSRTPHVDAVMFEEWDERPTLVPDED